MRKEELSKSKSTTTHHFVKTCLAVLYAKKIQLCALFSSITRPQNNFHYQIRNPGNDPSNGIVAGLLISCCDNCNHHFLCLSKSRCCVYRNGHNTRKKKPSSKLRRISETTHMPRPQLVICYLVPFKVGPFHQEGSVCSTSIRSFRLNNVPLSCCHMDAL